MAFIRGEKNRACRLGLLLPGLFLAALAHAETRWVPLGQEESIP